MGLESGEREVVARMWAWQWSVVLREPPELVNVYVTCWGGRLLVAEVAGLLNPLLSVVAFLLFFLLLRRRGHPYHLFVLYLPPPVGNNRLEEGRPHSKNIFLGVICRHLAGSVCICVLLASLMRVVFMCLLHVELSFLHSWAVSGLGLLSLPPWAVGSPSSAAGIASRRAFALFSCADIIPPVAFFALDPVWVLVVGLTLPACVATSQAETVGQIQGLGL